MVACATFSPSCQVYSAVWLVPVAGRAILGQGHPTPSLPFADAELADGGNSLGPSNQDQEDVSRYVIGPMVVRVMPDGSPVPGTWRCGWTVNN